MSSNYYNNVRQICLLVASIMLLCPTLSFAYEVRFTPSAEITVAENTAGNVGFNFTLVRTPADLSEPVPANCEFVLTPTVVPSGTAQQGPDWNFNSDALTQTISPTNTTELTFSGYVNIVNDSDVESTETIVFGTPQITSDNCDVTLAPEGATEPQFTVNINDNDSDRSDDDQQSEPARVSIRSGDNQSGDETTNFDPFVIEVTDVVLLLQHQTRKPAAIKYR